MNPLYNLYFVLINLVALGAVVINVGLTRDSFDHAHHRLTREGYIAAALLALSLLALLLFAQFYEMPNLDNRGVYLGFFVTASAYVLPFFSTTHDPGKEGWTKINLIGWLTVALGCIGLLPAFLRLMGLSLDYIALIGHCITVASALFALLGETIRTDSKGRFQLTDLGKLTFTVIVIGFTVSVVNSQIEEEEKRDIQVKMRKTLENLDTAQVKLNVLNEHLSETQHKFTRILDTTDKKMLYRLQALNRDIDTIIVKVGHTLNDSLHEGLVNIRRRIIGQIDSVHKDRLRQLGSLRRQNQGQDRLLRRLYAQTAKDQALKNLEKSIEKRFLDQLGVIEKKWLALKKLEEEMVLIREELAKQEKPLTQSDLSRFRQSLMREINQSLKQELDSLKKVK